MPGNLVVEIIGGCFIGFSILAFCCYMRIVFILKTIDKGLENPPVRPQIHDKLRDYRQWCVDRQRKPVLLLWFAVGVIGAVMSWLPLPWIVYR